MKYQVTLFSTKGYKAVSTIITVNDNSENVIREKGIKNICAKRYWTGYELKNYGYTKLRMRKLTEV